MGKLDGKVTVDNGVVSTKTESHWNCKCYPISLKQSIQDGQSFRINIVDAADKYFRIGVGISDLKPANWDELKNNVCIHPNGYLCSDGAQQKLNFTLETGQTVEVRRRGDTVEWRRNGELICSAPIPNSMLNRPLFPLCWIASLPFASMISKLQFV